MKAVFFDMDDTLYPRSGPFTKACQELLAPRMNLDWEELYRVRNRYGDEIFERQIQDHISDEEMYIYRMERSLTEYGQTISRDEILYFEERYAWYQGHIQLDTGYPELFQKLMDHGLLLGVITNGATAHQLNKLRALEMTPWIPETRWVISGSVGCIKPGKAIFDAALQAAGIEDPTECWFVGDNYKADICGARDAGWQGIWMRKPGMDMPGDGAAAASAIVTSVEELKQVLIEQMQKQP